MGRFDEWFDSYSRNYTKDQWRLEDAWEAGSADALTPHIAAEKEREEKLWALQREMPCEGEYYQENPADREEPLRLKTPKNCDCPKHRLAAILGGKGA
jgi:hypothetical protein